MMRMYQHTPVQLFVSILRAVWLGWMKGWLQQLPSNSVVDLGACVCVAGVWSGQAEGQVIEIMSVFDSLYCSSQFLSITPYLPLSNVSMEPQKCN